MLMIELSLFAALIMRGVILLRPADAVPARVPCPIRPRAVSSARDAA